MTFFIYFFWYDKRFKKMVGGPMKVFELAENLKSLGHKVVLFAPKIGYPEKQTSVKIVKIPVIGIPILGVIIYEFLLTWLSVYQLFKIRPDIIYVRIMTSFVPLITSKLLSIPLLTELNDDPFRGYRESKSSAVKLSLVKLVDKINFRLSDRIITITERIKWKLTHIMEIPQEKFHIIRSGSNVSLFVPMDKKECRIALGLDTNCKYVGFAGNYAVIEDNDSLIDCAGLVAQRFPEVKFLIIGNGRWKAYGTERAKRQNTDKFFIFIGYIPYKEVPKYMGAMDIGLAPHKIRCDGTTAVKIFDYLACERPVITNNLFSTGNFLIESGAVTFVPPEDSQALANAIIELLSNSNKMEQMGKNGRKFIVEKYSRKSVAKKIVEIVRDVG